MNKCVMIGRLANDVDLRRTIINNKPVANFRLSVRRPKNFGGLVYLDCKMWGAAAEMFSDRTEKGDFVAVAGWIDVNFKNKDGRKHKNVNVICDSFKILGGVQIESE